MGFIPGTELPLWLPPLFQHLFCVFGGNGVQKYYLWQQPRNLQFYCGGIVAYSRIKTRFSGK